jgi:hypothetical protein
VLLITVKTEAIKSKPKTSIFSNEFVTHGIVVSFFIVHAVSHVLEPD